MPVLKSAPVRAGAAAILAVSAVGAIGLTIRVDTAAQDREPVTSPAQVAAVSAPDVGVGMGKGMYDWIKPGNPVASI